MNRPAFEKEAARLVGPGTLALLRKIADDVAWEAVYGTRPDLLLAFWASMGFKPGDFRTIGMNEKRAAWLCRVLNRVTHPA
jgi:hypothetical protein